MEYLMKISVYAITLLLFPFGLFAAKDNSTRVEMVLKEIGKNIYYVEGVAGIATDNEGFISNAGVVVTDDGVIIFDSLGTPVLAEKLRQLIRVKTDKPVTHVFVSHYHADHFYGLQVFKDEGATIIAPSGANDYLDSPTAMERLEERRFSLDPWVNKNTRLVPPDSLIEQSQTFQFGNKILNINYQGKAHSDGDLSMLVEPDKVLFSGDLIFEGRIPFVGDADTAQWLQTLTRLETDGLSVLVPGHGPASLAPQDSIRLTRRYLAYLREIMIAGVDELLDFDEIYTSTDWSEFEILPAFKLGNRGNAYQVFLSIEQELLDQ
ncbi:MAG: glyoxylase-like metal-dependent hydrolase (beta-lactamase superfamily II) [Gammaproteobacteria bacterium]|jgi:glyoxylase-like metal-dependent hydrolase (beta-lactamase superfamily II)